VGPFGWEVVGSLAGVASVVLTIVFGVAPWIQRRRAVRDAVPAPALPPNRKSYLSRGESLHVGESLHSPDARTKFTLLDNANTVVSVAGLGDICDTGTTNRGVPGFLSWKTAAGSSCMTIPMSHSGDKGREGTDLKFRTIRTSCCIHRSRMATRFGQPICFSKPVSWCAGYRRPKMEALVVGEKP
jgi:hypothetical protein